MFSNNLLIILLFFSLKKIIDFIKTFPNQSRSSPSTVSASSIAPNPTNSNKQSQSQPSSAISNLLDSSFESLESLKQLKVKDAQISQLESQITNLRMELQKSKEELAFVISSKTITPPVQPPPFVPIPPPPTLPSSALNISEEIKLLQRKIQDVEKNRNGIEPLRQNLRIIFDRLNLPGWTSDGDIDQYVSLLSEGARRLKNETINKVDLMVKDVLKNDKNHRSIYDNSKPSSSSSLNPNTSQRIKK